MEVDVFDHDGQLLYTYPKDFLALNYTLSDAEMIEEVKKCLWLMDWLMYRRLKKFCLKFNMKKVELPMLAKAGFLAIIVQFLIVGGSHIADAFEVKMNLVTCQPDGIGANLQASYSGLKYWSEQAIALERLIENYSRERLDDNCSLRATNEIELEECRGYPRNYINAAQNCLTFSRRMLSIHKKLQ